MARSRIGVAGCFLLAVAGAGLGVFFFVWGLPDPWSRSVYKRVPPVSVYARSFDPQTAPVSGCGVLWIAAIRAHDEHQFAGSPPYRLHLTPHTIDSPRFKAWKVVSIEIRDTASQEVVWSATGTDWIASTPRSVSEHGVYAHTGWSSESDIVLRPADHRNIEASILIEIDLDGDGVKDCAESALLHFGVRESSGLFQPMHV